MEICCENCKYYHLRCFEIVGRCDLSLSKFKPKEKKMAWTPATTLKKTQITGDMNYKSTGKTLTARKVIAESTIHEDEAIRFIGWLKKKNIGLGWELFYYGFFLPYALKHACFKKYLLDKGYIEAVEEWKPVTIGDRFRINSGASNPYLLCSISDMVVLMGNSGLPWSDSIKVRSIMNITKKEFQLICGSIPVDELERI